MTAARPSRSQGRFLNLPFSFITKKLEFLAMFANEKEVLIIMGHVSAKSVHCLFSSNCFQSFRGSSPSRIYRQRACYRIESAYCM
jgi:hypothetical protein